MIKMEFSTTQRGARVLIYAEYMYVINIGRARMAESFRGVLRAGAAVKE